MAWFPEAERRLLHKMIGMDYRGVLPRNLL